LDSINAIFAGTASDSIRSNTSTRDLSSSNRGIDGRGPSSTPHDRQGPNLERLEGERLEGGGERLGPLTRSMTKLRMRALGQATDGRESNMYMLHEGPLRVA